MVLRHQLTKKQREKILDDFEDKISRLSQKDKYFSLYNLNMMNEMVKIRKDFSIKGEYFIDVLKNYIVEVSQSDLN